MQVVRVNQNTVITIKQDEVEIRKLREVLAAFNTNNGNSDAAAVQLAADYASIAQVT